MDGEGDTGGEGEGDTGGEGESDTGGESVGGIGEGEGVAEGTADGATVQDSIDDLEGIRVGECVDTSGDTVDIPADTFIEGMYTSAVEDTVEEEDGRSFHSSADLKTLSVNETAPILLESLLNTECTAIEEMIPSFYE